MTRPYFTWSYNAEFGISHSIVGWVKAKINHNVYFNDNNTIKIIARFDIK